MKLFGGRLSVISVPELIDYAAHTKGLIRLELCNCNALGKLVVRVAGQPTKGAKEEILGVLVDTGSEEYFVAARSINSIRNKLARLLMPSWKRFVIVPQENCFLQLFQGGAVTEIASYERR